MLNFRKRVLKKFAQATTPAVTSTTISGSPPSFIASQAYPSIVGGFGPQNLAIIDQLSNVLNIALFYSSTGKLSLPVLKSNSFSTAPDQASSEDLKQLIIFAKQVFSIFYNSGNPIAKLTPEQISAKVTALKNNQALNSLPSTAGTQLSTKISGNLKETIINLLNQIK